jgi:hypothetical protein
MRRDGCSFAAARLQTAAATCIMGKRWEDLFDAAASATEEDSGDFGICYPSQNTTRATNRNFKR